MGQYEQIYCAICGVLHLSPGLREQSEQSTWLEEATVLAKREDAHQQDLSCPIPVLEFRAQYDGNGYEVFHLVDLDKDITVNKSDIDERRHSDWEEEDDMEMCIPVHTSCLNITRRVFSNINGQESSAKVKTMNVLWNVLSSRVYDANDHFCSFLAAWIVDEPHSYYGAGQFQGQSWTLDGVDRDYDRLPHDRMMYLETDPLTIPHLTDSILSALEPMNPSKISSKPPGTSALPQEIQDMIFKAIHDQGTVPIEPTYVLPPIYWRQALVQKVCLPWLWDLDTSTVDAKDSSCPGGRVWDWESLFRQLAQRSIFDPDTKQTMSDLAPGLRNRRRIWQLVEDIRVEDRSEDLAV